jgi:hypothetical protein
MMNKDGFVSATIQNRNSSYTDLAVYILFPLVLLVKVGWRLCTGFGSEGGQVMEG